MSKNELLDEIKALEESLLHGDFKEDLAALHSLLADDFEEVGPGGQLASRESVIEWLLSKDTNARWDFQSFKLKVLSDNLVLARYHAKQIAPVNSDSIKPHSQGSLRSSVWQKNPDSGCWQMQFHQATKLIEN